MCCVDICKASTFVSKSDMSALRYIVPAIEVELKERLFNPAQPFKGPDGQIDEDLMVDCLVSSFYLNARKVCNSLFADCLKPTTPKLFKFVLVRCLLRVATASTSLSLSLSLSQLLTLVFLRQAVTCRGTQRSRMCTMRMPPTCAPCSKSALRAYPRSPISRVPRTRSRAS